MIRTIIFDLGGVIVTLDQPQAVRRFMEIGLKDAERRLDPYTQSGMFGDLERGKNTLRMDKVNDVLALFGECLGPVKTDIV